LRENNLVRRADKRKIIKTNLLGFATLGDGSKIFLERFFATKNYIPVFYKNHRFVLFYAMFSIAIEIAIILLFILFRRQFIDDIFSLPGTVILTLFAISVTNRLFLCKYILQWISSPVDVDVSTLPTYSNNSPQGSSNDQ